MNKIGLVACIGGLLAMAACAPTVRDETYSAPAPVPLASDLALSGIDVRVRDGMVVSVEDTRYPPAEHLVWYGDGPGDKRAQVAALMSDAVGEGLSGAMTGGRAAMAEVRIIEFHALTPRSRRSNLQVGVHSIAFDIVLKDAQTGQTLAQEVNFRADLKALSGDRARQAQARGDTQKVRISRHVAKLVKEWAAGV